MLSAINESGRQIAVIVENMLGFAQNEAGFVSQSDQVARIVSSDNRHAGSTMIGLAFLVLRSIP